MASCLLAVNAVTTLAPSRSNKMFARGAQPSRCVVGGVWGQVLRKTREQKKKCEAVLYHISWHSLTKMLKNASGGEESAACRCRLQPGELVALTLEHGSGHAANWRQTTHTCRSFCASDLCEVRTAMHAHLCTRTYARMFDRKGCRKVARTAYSFARGR